jgi:hypothetical protein
MNCQARAGIASATPSWVLTLRGLLDVKMAFWHGTRHHGMAGGNPATTNNAALVTKHARKPFGWLPALHNTSTTHVQHHCTDQQEQGRRTVPGKTHHTVQDTHVRPITKASTIQLKTALLAVIPSHRPTTKPSLDIDCASKFLNKTSCCSTETSCCPGNHGCPSSTRRCRIQARPGCRRKPLQYTRQRLASDLTACWLCVCSRRPAQHALKSTQQLHCCCGCCGNRWQPAVPHLRSCSTLFFHTITSLSSPHP